jgi:hypothetical protein
MHSEIKSDVELNEGVEKNVRLHVDWIQWLYISKAESSAKGIPILLEVRKVNLNIGG